MQQQYDLWNAQFTNALYLIESAVKGWFICVGE